MGLQYVHKALSSDELICILKIRGLLIDDDEQAKDILEKVSFFHLAGYWRHFETDSDTHQFIKGCRFSDIVALYRFDKELRILLFSAIQTIEVAIRTKMINLFSVKLGAFWFMDSKYAIDNERFNSNLKIISESVERSKDVSIISHRRKYSSPSLPPIWKTLEVVSLGTLSKLYSNS